MGKQHSELSLTDREHIAIYRGQGWSFRRIGEALGRSGPTISREYHRNQGDDGVYLASVAHAKAKARKSKAGERESKCEAYKETIHYHLGLGWSPSQISGRLGKRYKAFNISYETIYRYLYSQHIEWAKLLPRKHEPRWTKGMCRSGSKKEMIPGRTGIEERPEAINDKSEFGHWEGDSIVCSQSVVSLNVLVERQTQKVVISRVDNRGAGATRDAMIKALSRFKKGGRKSITLDNGIEFKWHQEVKKALKIDTYFWSYN